MNSGLYARAGFSATATAAPLAKRFDEPMTKLSNVWFGFSDWLRCGSSVARCWFMRLAAPPSAGPAPEP